MVVLAPSGAVPVSDGRCPPCAEPAMASLDAHDRKSWPRAKPKGRGIRRTGRPGIRACDRIGHTPRSVAISRSAPDRGSARNAQHPGFVRGSRDDPASHDGPLSPRLLRRDDALPCQRAAAEADPGAGVGLRPAGPQGARQGVSEQARARHGRARRREGPEGPAPGVLRLLRLALVGARPLDARAAAPPASPTCPRRARSAPCSRTT